MRIDTRQPFVPGELYDENYKESVLKDLWTDVCNELADPTYLGRSHNAGTYERGCHGPVCKKANREHTRRKATAGVLVRPQDNRIYDPVIEYFYTVMKYRIRAAQQDILKELKGTG